ncbi:MAG TPA: DUF4239 domain-containing protein [Candidatus Binataceae bacterium]|nr:DUF4239 domain-containing protein [Candidatus Binataceae bacterium]
MDLIDGLGTLEQAVVVILFFSGATILGLYLVRRLLPAHILSEDHEVAGYTFGVVGAFYGVVLAFVIVAAWQRFERADDKAQAEALALSNLYSLSKGFPQPMRANLGQATGDYARQVVNHEWDEMATLEFEHTLDGEGQLWQVLLSYNPQNNLETDVLAKCLDEMDALSDARQLRYVYYKEDLPSVVWLVIYAGCVITIAFSYFCGSRRFWPQAIMSATFALLIGLTIMAIAELANPYQGAVTVTNAPFKFVLKIIEDDAARLPSAANAPAASAATLGRQ